MRSLDHLEPYRRLAVNVARQKLGSKASYAEDVVQDTLVSLLQVDTERTIDFGYFIVAVRNHVCLKLRELTAVKRGSGLEGMSDDLATHIPSPDPTPIEAAIAHEEAEELYQKLSSLAPDKRAALTGYYIEGKSYKDLQSENDWNENAVKRNMYVGMNQMRRLFNPVP